VKPPIWRAKPDPPPGEGGTCAVCGGERPERAIEYGDPFCSAPCARKWHKTKDAAAATPIA